MASPDIHVAKAERYVSDVLSGRVAACKWVRLACERQRRDLGRQKDPAWPYRFAVDVAGRICRFIEQLPHIKGPKTGQKIELENWQCFYITTAFGWVRKDNGRRRFRKAYGEVPRGNAKSTLSSGVALYCLAADGEGGAEVYSAATTREQARIVFRDAQQMARKSPDLSNALGIAVRAHNIAQLRTASRFEALSSEGQSLDGLNIHLAVVDELHAHRTREVFDVLETGCGKRDQSMLWTITTAGSNRAGICYEVRTYLTKILEGVVEDEAFFGCIWTIDEGDDWLDPKTWEKANPNWGVSVMPEIIAMTAAKAKAMPASTNNFLTKHLNVWVNANSPWMPMPAWDRCADPSLRIEQFKGKPCVIGLDLASKIDIAAKLSVFPVYRDGNLHVYAFMQCYLPEAAIAESRNSQYAGWEIEGYIKSTPGDVTDFGVIEDDLRADAAEYDVREVAFDPWQATQLAQRMGAEGATMVEYRNTVANFSAPMKEIEALVRTGRFHHDGNPVLAWMASNVVAHLDAKENIYPRKEFPENKIDGIVALIMAVGRVIFAEIAKPSVYEKRGLITL